MKTIKIVDGDFSYESGTGILEWVQGEQKGGQDIARHVLCTYQSEFQEGNRVMNIIMGESPGNLTEAQASVQINESVQRLILKTQSSPDGERLVGISRFRTQVVRSTALVFYLVAEFQNGSTTEVGNFINLKPTSLRHLLNADAILKV
jgi:hypothetical protein